MSIKIEGPSSLRASAVKRAGKSDGAAAARFAKLMHEDVSGPSGVASANPVTAVDSLLALQEVDDATARASKGKKRAQDLLDSLDELRHGLLAGTIPREKLHALAKMAQSRRAQVDDPRLAELLDEIDLRAQVELAKYTS